MVSTIFGTRAVAIAYEVSTSANDARLLFFGPNHEAGHVLHEEQWYAEPITAIDEVSDLLRALRIDDAAKARLLTLASFDQAALVCNNANRDSVNARVAADHLIGDAVLEFVDLPVVEDYAQHRVHVVGHAMIGRQNV